MSLPPGPKFLNRLISLDSTIPDDPATAKRVAAFLAMHPAPQQSQTAASRTIVSEPGYSVGSSGCISCHDRPYKKWVANSHSRAMAKIPREKLGDATCFPCHSTELVRQAGKGRESTVSCEACHGRGSAHPGVGKVTRKVDGAICLGCHRGEHDRKPFDLEGGYRKIRCDN
jgi:Cytochrome c554 and c-prime